MNYEMIEGYDELREGITEAHNADADYYGGYVEIDVAEVELSEIMGV